MNHCDEPWCVRVPLQLLLLLLLLALVYKCNTTQCMRRLVLCVRARAVPGATRVCVYARAEIGAWSAWVPVRRCVGGGHTKENDTGRQPDRQTSDTRDGLHSLQGL